MRKVGLTVAFTWEIISQDYLSSLRSETGGSDFVSVLPRGCCAPGQSLYFLPEFPHIVLGLEDCLTHESI